MSQRVRSSLTTAAVFLVAASLAMVGLVWITIWATAELRVHVGDWAPLLIGLLLFVPLVVVAIWQSLRATPAPPAPEPVAAATRPFLGDNGADIAAAAKGFVQKSPLTALALGALAGLLLSRSHGALARLLDALDETPR